MLLAFFTAQADMIVSKNGLLTKYIDKLFSLSMHLIQWWLSFQNLLLQMSLSQKRTRMQWNGFPFILKIEILSNGFLRPFFQSALFDEPHFPHSVYKIMNSCKKKKNKKKKKKTTSKPNNNIFLFKETKFKPRK